ncbi:MAG: cell division protein ZapA [Bdellovibrionaceae bacterium]|nr:cell division protein ZapA [Pseudobdellovibrionaceae bacterium]
MSEKKTYEFHIAGVPYRLRTSHEEEFVSELVDFINRRMQAALSATKKGSFQNAAVLTALNLAEELILLKKRAQRELSRIEEKALKLSIELENTKAGSM